VIRLLEKDATMSILCVLWQKSAERSISALNALTDESIDFFLQHDGYSSSAANRQSKFLGILTLCCTIRTTENVHLFGLLPEIGGLGLAHCTLPFGAPHCIM